MNTLTLVTDHGPLDLCFSPAGFADGFVELRVHAEQMMLDDAEFQVASLEDVIASKRAAGRTKDIVALPELEAAARRRKVSPGD